MRTHTDAAALLLATITGLSACGGGPSGSSGNAAADGDASATAPEDLSALSTSRLVTIPDAENLLFTPAGRLFVTGDRVYEIIRSDDTFAATPVDDGQCPASPGFLGLAQRGNVVYAVCGGDTALYAGLLGGTLSNIHTLDGMGFPNGMGSDAQGNLYVVDGPTTLTPQIVRLRFGSDPMQVMEQSLWTDQGLEFPNGITRDGNTFFITDASLARAEPGNVKRIALNPDGSPGEPEVIYVHTAVLDDLDVAGTDALLVTVFTGGDLLLLGRDGTLRSQTGAGSFVSASASMLGRAPLFEDGDVLVTDKGTLGDQQSNTGNALFLLQ